MLGFVDSPKLSFHGLTITDTARLQGTLKRCKCTSVCVCYSHFASPLLHFEVHHLTSLAIRYLHTTGAPLHPMTLVLLVDIEFNNSDLDIIR